MSARLVRTKRLSHLRPILLVDDDDSIRELLIDLLSSGAHPVIGAANGREALELLTSREDPPCLVVTDLMMPGMSGWELLDAMKAEPRLSAIPAIVVSASFLEGVAVCATHDAPTRFLSKPICPDRLVGMIDSLCTCTSASGFRARATKMA